jgi:hypothetical protein
MLPYSYYSPQLHHWSVLCHLLLLLTVFVRADNSSKGACARMLFTYGFNNNDFDILPGNDQLRLVQKLFQDYDKTLRSVHNTATTTKVRLNPALNGITETDEASESILFSLWFRMVSLQVEPRNNTAIKSHVQQYQILCH